MLNRKTRSGFLAIIGFVAFAIATPAGSNLPTIVVLATGGTIAGAASSDVQAA
jgi:L-asparaginase/Glu-tRNA(Gln) amidotransferase subunit D